MFTQIFDVFNLREWHPWQALNWRGVFHLWAAKSHLDEVWFFRFFGGDDVWLRDPSPFLLMVPADLLPHFSDLWRLPVQTHPPIHFLICVGKERDRFRGTSREGWLTPAVGLVSPLHSHPICLPSHLPARVTAATNVAVRSLEFIRNAGLACWPCFMSPSLRLRTGANHTHAFVFIEYVFMFIECLLEFFSIQKLENFWGDFSIQGDRLGGIQPAISGHHCWTFPQVPRPRGPQARRGDLQVA